MVVQCNERGCIVSARAEDPQHDPEPGLTWRLLGADAALDKEQVFDVVAGSFDFVLHFKLFRTQLVAIDGFFAFFAQTFEDGVFERAWFPI